MRAELITGCRQENAPSEEQAHGNLPYNPQVSLAPAVGSSFRHSLLTTCCCLETKHDGEHVISIDLGEAHVQGSVTGSNRAHVQNCWQCIAALS